MPPKKTSFHRSRTGGSAGKAFKTKRRTKDLDEIDADLKPGKVENLVNQPIDLDLPGCGQHYCVHCARHFIDEFTLKHHMKSKVHKRRMKALELEPYSIAESLRAGGMGSYVAPKKRKITNDIYEQRRPKLLALDEDAPFENFGEDVELKEVE